jgi:hypothetical protein
MSSLFDTHDRVRRLREVFAYVRDAASDGNDELRNALERNADERTRKEWEKLVSEVREFLREAERLAAPAQVEPVDDDVPEAMLAELAKRFRAGATVH